MAAVGSGATAVRELKKPPSTEGFANAVAAQKAMAEANTQLALAMKHLYNVHGAAQCISSISRLEHEASKVQDIVTQIAAMSAVEQSSQVVRVALLELANGTAKVSISIIA